MVQIGSGKAACEFVMGEILGQLLDTCPRLCAQSDRPPAVSVESIYGKRGIVVSVGLTGWR